jgi:hypothetical protein
VLFDVPSFDSSLFLQQKHLITNIAILSGIIIKSAYPHNYFNILILVATTFSLIPTDDARS